MKSSGLFAAALLLLASLFSCKPAREYDLLTSGNRDLVLSSPDTFLVSLFNWAKSTSLGYAGSGNDPVGPWYEAALPGREAFCIRDVSHQCIGSEIIGLGQANLNMFRKFVGNISERKDYCSYWEINRYNKPAPVDYASDDDFWYNLNANFDIIDACYKLYQWTGDSTYITDPVFDRFFELTLNEYTDRWQLGARDIMQRPPVMNLKPGTVKYRFARGIPSYDEGQSDISVSSDLLGMICNGFAVYSKILRIRGEKAKSEIYGKKAEKYFRLLDSLWWDGDALSYYGFYKTDGKFYRGGIANSEFLLWYDVIKDPAKAEKSLNDIRNTQIEVLSYLPFLFYRNGLNGDAYGFLQKIHSDKRKAYPEGASGAIEGIVRGLMGIQPVADEKVVITCPRLTDKTPGVTLENVPVLSGLVSVRHESDHETSFANKSSKPLVWRAMFMGSHNIVRSGKQALKAMHQTDRLGNIYSYADIALSPGSQASASVDLSDIARNEKWPQLGEVVLVWKTHCDIGYTHPVPEVLDYYRTGMMDGALKLIEDTLNTPKEERFVWMLPAWVMEVILDDKQTPERRARIEKAIRDGRIVWHALPYTFESEAADLEELVRSLGSGTRLARKFNKPLPADAKLTDMPSQAWVLPTLLSKAGIKFVHIGVNPWSPNPEVPELFWWEGPDGSRVLTGYSFHSYSWPALPPDNWTHKSWLCFQVTGDNSGPPTAETVKTLVSSLKRQLPGVKIRFGRPSDFADAIISENDPSIPVVRGDMPDTWTHGQMTMPVATQIHRKTAAGQVSLGILGTEMAGWKITDGDVSGILSRAYDRSSLFAEHTWGIAGPSFGSPDHASWLENLRQGKYEKQLATFGWHAAYASDAMEITRNGISELMTKLAASVAAEGKRIVVFNPLPYVRSDMVTVEIPSGIDAPEFLTDIQGGIKIPVRQDGRAISFLAPDVPAGGYKTFPFTGEKGVGAQDIQGSVFETSFFRVTFDTGRGGISSLVLKSDGRELVDSGEHALGQFMHERFAKAEVDSFLKAYCQVYYTWYGFPYYDFNKPNLDPGVTYNRFTPGKWDLSVKKDANGIVAILSTKDTRRLAKGYTLRYFFPDGKPYIDIEWSVDGKSAEIIPEGGWLCVPLAINKPMIRVSHVSAPFDPAKDLVPGTNHHLFSTDFGIMVRDGASGPGAAVSSSDLPLWSIGEPGLWKYSRVYKPVKPELFANLYNNQWNTNYPLWVDGSWKAAFRIWPVTAGANEEEALFTPGWENRQQMLSAYSESGKGSLPVSETGLSLSRRGIRVTTFCHYPDTATNQEVTLLRLWEQAGQPGMTEISLPRGIAAGTAQPVDLRGQKTGKGIKIINGKFTVNIDAYSPASFLLY